VLLNKEADRTISGESKMVLSAIK